MLKCKIMIVDDDEIIQFTTKMTLKFIIEIEGISGYTNPTKALKYLQENQGVMEAMPDIILLDINMPFMDGFEFLEFFHKTIDQNIPVIFMVSSSVDFGDVKRSLAYPSVCEYISKPIDANTLKEKILKHLK